MAGYYEWWIWRNMGKKVNVACFKAQQLLFNVKHLWFQTHYLSIKLPPITFYLSLVITP
jgi:hypothetical protein